MMDEGERALKILSSMSFANAFAPYAMYVYSKTDVGSTANLQSFWSKIFVSNNAWHNAAIGVLIFGQALAYGFIGTTLFGSMLESCWVEYAAFAMNVVYRVVTPALFVITVALYLIAAEYLKSSSYGTSATVHYDKNAIYLQLAYYVGMVSITRAVFSAEDKNLIKALAPPEPAGDVRLAQCVIEGENISGSILFEQFENGQLWVGAYVSRLSEGSHGMHVHTNPITGGECSSAGEVWNPTEMDHGSWDGDVRKAGSLQSLVSKSEYEETTLEYMDPVATLFGDDSILGRSIVIHAGADDLGLGDDEGSKANGNSGDPIACCTITRVGS